MATCLTTKFKSYLSSGWEFDSKEYLQKQRYYLVNIVIALGIVAVLQGILHDILVEDYVMMVIDIGMITFFVLCSYLLRRDKRYYDITTTLNALISLIYLNLLIVSYPIENLEFIWLFFFVVTYMFLKGPKVGVAWNVGLFASLFIMKAQPFVSIDFSYAQLGYLVFALSIIMIITYFFLHVIDENYQIILEQGEKLRDFNTALEQKVSEKTDELRHLNLSLEDRIEQKVAVVHEQQEMLITQSRLAAMGEMLSMIAHQWRQPLATTTLRISNMQIKSMLDDKERDERDELLVSVSDTLIYLSDTIDDFQTYFKPDNKTEKVNVNDLVDRACNFVKARADIFGITIIRPLQSELMLEVQANELIQVMINILNNAVDVIISSKAADKVVKIMIERSDKHVQIKIIDSGDGIQPALLTQIFEPYFSTKSKNGTGLGLYMAKMIIQEHMKGQIFAENSEEGGAEFIIELPYEKEVNTTTQKVA